MKACSRTNAATLRSSSQKLKLISPTVRVNLTALWIFRLHNHSDLLEGVIKEYSALIDSKTLPTMFRQATEKPYGFLYINHIIGMVIIKYIMARKTCALKTPVIAIWSISLKKVNNTSIFTSARLLLNHNPATLITKIQPR